MDNSKNSRVLSRPALSGGMKPRSAHRVVAPPPARRPHALDAPGVKQPRGVSAAVPGAGLVATAPDCPS